MTVPDGIEKIGGAGIELEEVVQQLDQRQQKEAGYQYWEHLRRYQVHQLLYQHEGSATSHL